MAGAIVLGVCVFLLFFWVCYRAQTSDGWRGAYNRSDGNKDAGGGAAPASLSAAMVVPAKPPSRLLWEVNTAGGMDFFSELLPAGGWLVAMRRGVLYGLDARTGETCWRYPLVGTAIEPYDPNYGIWGNVVLAVRGDRVIMLARHGLIEISLRNGNELREYHVDAKVKV